MDNRKVTPWLSVIIPVYNGEATIARCLDSILRQTYRDFEIVIVDDGSTDKTAGICRAYAEKDGRIRYYYKENGGAFRARIFGTEQIRGEYFTFCDADDDYCTGKAFEILHDSLVKHPCDAVQFGNRKQFNHLYKTEKPSNRAEDMDAVDFRTKNYPVLLCSFWDTARINCGVWNKVYHKHLLKTLPASVSAERVFWGDDLILNLHLLSVCESFRLLPDVLYRYRDFSGGTNKFNPRTMEDLDNIKKYQLRFLEQYQGTDKETVRSILYSELAGWFLCWVREGAKHLPDAELRSLIETAFRLPRFVLAREYYLTQNKEHWEAVALLKQGDADVYLVKAKEPLPKPGMKAWVIRLLKKIYKAI
ncbi:MAG: glycosyltransferase family 2 protein [Clostridia bacterium]|nr:glycosyltransferase family 2 protein [Clostridia bacterium]